jgi:hypothetical protein
MPMTAKQVAERLSLKEFMAVCRFFDQRKMELKYRSAGLAQFSIYGVERGEKLIVMCSDGSQMINLDCSAERTDGEDGQKGTKVA